jgi:hypothetical protein
LGINAGQQGHFEESGRWLIKSILAFVHTNDQHSASQAAHNFQFTYRSAPPPDQAKLKALWTEAGLPPEALTENQP